MAFTFKTSGSNIEVFEDGQRISTTTPQLAQQQFGFNPEGGVAPKLTGFQQSQLPGATSAFGETVLPQLAQATPVTTLSSEEGQNIVAQNNQTLTQLEEPFFSDPSIVNFLERQGEPSDFESRAKLAEEQGIQNFTGTAEQNTQLLNALRNTSTSPAGQAITDEINKAVQNGNLTDIDQGALDELRTAQDDFTALLAEARSAQEAGEFARADSITQQLQERKTELEAQRDAFFKQVAPLRQQLLQSAVPGEKEQQLSKQLIDFRTETDKIKLENEKRKFKEFEGQTAGFAQKRGQAFDVKLSFQLRERALTEQNMLLSLGLEQESRKMAGLAVEQQLKFISEDFELQLDIQDRLDAEEDNLIQRAQTLRNEARDTLGSILDSLEGVNPDDFTPEMEGKLRQIANEAGIPFDLIQAGLKVQHARQIFDDSIKERTRDVAESREARLGQGNTTSTPAPIGQIFTDVSGATSKELKEDAKRVFSREFANKIISELNDEQLREFMRDYEAVSQKLRQSIEPELFLREWKKEVGIETTNVNTSGIPSGSSVFKN